MSDWIIQTITQTGYLGIFMMMLLENIFPPIPSELIMPFAGYVAAQGKLNLWLVWLAGTAGTVAGTLPWYWAGKRFGQAHLKRLAAKHGRWMTVTPDEVDEASIAFKRHGVLAVLLGRVVPGLRTLISVPAGVTGMEFGIFMVYTVAGSALWVGLLGGLGYVLGGQQDLVAEYLDPVSKVVLGLLLAGYVYRVVTFKAK